jgi:hypothetical protein
MSKISIEGWRYNAAACFLSRFIEIQEALSAFGYGCSGTRARKRLGSSCAAIYAVPKK